MNKKLLAISCVLFSFVFCFLVVGYAKFSDVMLLTGKAEVNTPQGLFITSVVRKGNANRLDVYNASFTEYSTTVTEHFEPYVRPQENMAQ